MSIADMMINGELCAKCAGMLEEPTPDKGIPQVCLDCYDEEDGDYNEALFAARERLEKLNKIVYAQEY